MPYYKFLPHNTVSQQEKALSDGKTSEERPLEMHGEIRVVDLFEPLYTPT